MQFTNGTEKLTINSLSSTRRQAGAEDALLGAQLHAIKYPGQKVSLLGPGIQTAGGARLRHDGRTTGDIQNSRRTDNSSAFPRVCGSETHLVSWLSRSAGS